MSWLREDGLIRLSRKPRPGRSPRRPRPARRPVVRVKARARGAGRRPRLLRAGVLALGPLALAAGALLVWLAAREAGHYLFAANDRYTLRHLEVRAASAKTRALARDYTRIREGMNLFAFSLSDVRRTVLENAPSFKSMRLTRYLPDTLVVEVVERAPLARIGRRGGFVADRDGFVFVVGSGSGVLPAIVGFTGAAPGPGDRLDGPAQAALRVIELCENPVYGMRIDTVDVGNPEFLRLRLGYAGKVREVAFAWPGMQAADTEDLDAPARQLARVKHAFDTPQGRNRTSLDATMGSRLTGGVQE